LFCLRGPTIKTTFDQPCCFAEAFFEALVEVQKMRKEVVSALVTIATAISLIVIAGCQTAGPGKAPVRRITVEDYMDKMKAAWIGQMAGVGWGGPTELH